jgi:hypothetical protein
MVGEISGMSGGVGPYRRNGRSARSLDNTRSPDLTGLRGAGVWIVAISERMMLSDPRGSAEDAAALTQSPAGFDVRD